MVVDLRAELRYTIRRARTRGPHVRPMTGCVFERTAGHVITETWTQTVCPAPAAVLLVGLGGWVRRCSCFADSESETERHRERERESEHPRCWSSAVGRVAHVRRLAWNYWCSVTDMVSYECVFIPRPGAVCGGCADALFSCMRAAD